MASLVYLHSAAAIRRVAGCGRRRLSPYYVDGIRATHAAAAPNVARRSVNFLMSKVNSYVTQVASRF